jgi:hypothetical protein
LDEVSAIFFIAASLLQSRNQCHQSDGAWRERRGWNIFGTLL